MLQTLIFAQRNLWRHRRRTLAGLGAIAFGIAALVMATGFIDWIFWAMRETAIESRLGHIQVTRPGYIKEGAADPLRYLLPNDHPLLDALKTDPQVRVVAPRLAFSGLASHGDATVSFLGEGVDADAEKLASKSLITFRGVPLKSDDPKSFLLGRGLATSIGVEPGDGLVLLVNTPGGGFNAVEGNVGGLFFTPTKAYDDLTLRLPIATTRQLLRVEGSHTWVVVLKETEDTAAVLERLRQEFGGEDFEFVPWYELADFYNKTVALFSRQMGVVWVIIAVIIVLSISNMLTMTALERTGEIGTQLALGDRRRKILVLLLAEGALLGVVGGAAGAVAGGIGGVIVSNIGIPMPPPPGMDVGFTGEILITPALLLQGWTLGAATATLAAFYPAWQASRISIIEGLRYNR